MQRVDADAKAQGLKRVKSTERALVGTSEAVHRASVALSADRSSALWRSLIAALAWSTFHEC